MSETNKTLKELHTELGEILEDTPELADAEVFLPDPRELGPESVIPLLTVTCETRRFCEVREGGIRRSIGGGYGIFLRSWKSIDPDE